VRHASTLGTALFGANPDCGNSGQILAKKQRSVAKMSHNYRISLALAEQFMPQKLQIAQTTMFSKLLITVSALSYLATLGPLLDR
jgi:hypothetical protein